VLFRSAMKTSLLAAWIVAVVSLVAPVSTHASSDLHFSAKVDCKDPVTKAVLYQGTVEVSQGPSDDIDDTRDNGASVHDGNGHVYPSQGFGVSGEIDVDTGGSDPATRRVELGKARPEGLKDADLLYCPISIHASDSRRLTDADVTNLGLRSDLLGTAAEVDTSVSGVIWIKPPPPLQ